MRRLVAAGLLALALVALVGQWRRAERRLESSHLVWAVKQRGQAASSGQAPSGVLAGAIPMIREAQALDPVSIEAAAAAADLYFLLGRDETAREGYLAAMRLEARPELYLNLGILELRRGDFDQAKVYLRAARRLDRRLVKPANAAWKKYGGNASQRKSRQPGGTEEPSRSDAARSEDGPDRTDQDR